jgi:hypothetical protein
MDEAIPKATQAVERAQAIYDAALEEYNDLKLACEAEYKILHPGCPPLELHKYVMEILKAAYDSLARKEENLKAAYDSLARKEENLARKKENLTLDKELLLLQRERRSAG